MITDRKIRLALDQLRSEFIAVVPITDLLIELRSRSLIYDNIVNKTKGIITREDINKQFINILLNHCNNFTFFLICDVIKNHDDSIVQDFGLKLELLARGRQSF